MPKLTPEQMVAPRAIAPFEAAFAFALWQERWKRDRPRGVVGRQAWVIIATDACGGLGPPFAYNKETDLEFGERAALALFTLIKEA